MSDQRSLFEAPGREQPWEQVPGLRFLEGWVTHEEEARLLTAVDAAPWLQELRRRRVQHYGWRYDYRRRSVDPDLYLGPLPAWAASLAARLHATGLMPEMPDQLIVNEYLPGQGIARHVDCEPCFGPVIASLSLGSGCVMEFTHLETRECIPVFLPPRSLVVLGDAARYEWAHAIRPRKQDPGPDGVMIPRGRRVSLTFRRILRGV